MSQFITLIHCIRQPKYWSFFSFSISPSNEYSGLISFRIDWFDLFAVHGTLKSLLQHHSSKESVLQCSAFFIVQFLHPYMTTGETRVLTRWTSVGKVMSLLFNMLSRLGKHGNSERLYFWGSKITADGDCSHEIKRCLLLGRKAMTILDSMLKSRHYFTNKDLSSQSYCFSSSHVWMWDLDYKESWVLNNGCFWTMVLEKTLEKSLGQQGNQTSPS